MRIHNFTKTFAAFFVFTYLFSACSDGGSSSNTMMLIALSNSRNTQASQSAQSGQNTSGNNDPATPQTPVTSVVESVTLSSQGLTISNSETATLVATVNGTNLTDADKVVKWTSSDEKVATVSGGVVTAVATGETTVTAASVKDPTKTATCIVKVEAATTSKILYNFDFSILGNIASGTTANQSFTSETFKDAVYFLANNTSSSLRFRGPTDENSKNSFNYNNANTTATATAVGSTVTTSANFYAGIDLSKLNIASPDTVTLSVTYKSFGSTNASAKDSGIVYLVDASNKAVAVKTGVALKSGCKNEIITADVPKKANIKILFSRNGSGAGGIDITEIKVVDKNSSEQIVRPSSISLSKTSLSFTITDDNLAPAETLTATVLPANVTSGYETVTWTSSNESVATVSGGVVTAKGAGTATITVSTSNGKSATANVSVTSTVSKKYITKNDKPLGFAQIDVSKMTKGEVTVTTRSDFVSKVQAGGYIVYVDGKIDLSDGMMPTSAGGTSTKLDEFVKTVSSGAYTSYKTFIDEYTKSCVAATDNKENTKKSSWANCSSLADKLWYFNGQYGNKIRVNVASNTMIIGLEGAEIYGGCFNINSVNNVAIRNLTIRDAYDPFPHHEKNDGFNAEHDCIVIQGSSYNIWIDHCTMKDTYHCEKAANGEKFQTYDGLCDMKNNTYNLTVSYCRLQDHDKTMLIGSSDTDGSNKTRTITLHHNYFLNCGQRLPMVRNTRLHNFNNYYDTDANKYWGQSYAVGVRENVLCVSENNYFGSGIQYSYKDSQGLLYKNGDVDNSSKKCNTTTLKTAMSDVFTPTYTYTLDDASTLNTSVPASAGAGVWTVRK